MADTAGMQDIRSIQLNSLIKGFADEELTFDKFVSTMGTDAREVRWIQKTAGFLSSTDTTALTASRLTNMAHLALPEVIEPSFTRNTSYVKPFIAESPWVSLRDIKDSMIPIWVTIMRDVTRAVLKDVNDHIYNVLTENQSAVNILSTASTAAWDAASGVKIITDINTGTRKIRTNNYEPTHIFLSPTDFASMMVELVETRGASIPAFSSAKLENGVITEIFGLKVVVSNSVAADSALICAPQRALTLHTFNDLSTAVKTDEGIANKFRVWCDKIAVLTDPKACHLTTNTQT